MNANVTKNNRSKLLVAVFALAVIMAGCVVVFSDESQAVTVEDFQKEITDNKGVYTVNGEETLTVTEPIADLKEIKGEAGKENSLTINFRATEKYQSMIVVDASGLTIDGVKVTLNMTAISSLNNAKDGLTVFGGAVIGGSATDSTGNVTVQNGASLTISQAANAHGASWRAGDLIVKGATVDFNQANSTGNLTVDLEKATLRFTNPNATPGNLSGTADGSKIIATGATANSLNFSTINLNNSTVDTDGDVGVYEGENVEMTGTSSITADELYTKNSNYSTDAGNVTGGSINADVVSSPDKPGTGESQPNGVLGMEINGSSVDGSVSTDTTTTSGYTLNGNHIETGQVVYSGIIKTKLTITDANAILVDVTVNPGVTLKINDAATVKGDMRVYGTIAPATAPTDNKATATLTVGQDATLTAYAGASVAKGLDVVSTGNGKIDLSAAMSTVTLNDDIESDFNASQSQKVVIADTLTIKTGYKMTILGELVINEGCTVIIEDGAKLIVGSTDKIKATGVTVNGNIEVENGGTIEVQNAEDVTVVGTITSSGTVTINSNVTVKNGGSIVIEDYENDKGEQTSNIDVDKGLTVEAGGELSIAGNMYIGTISNKGTVTLDGAIIAERSTIQMTAAGAVVDIKSMTQKVIGGTVCSLIVEDYELYLYTDKATEKDVTVSADDKNIIAFDGAVKGTGANAVDVTDGIGIRNITITSVLETEKVDKDTTNYYNQFVISGSPSIYDDTVNGDFNGTYAINMNAYNKSSGASYVISSIEVPESLTIGKNVNVTLGNASFGGVMNVDGTIDVTADGASLKSNGQIYVNGMIAVALDNDAINSGINAFNYEDDDNNYYTTLKTAVDNAADDIEYLGDVKVLDSLTIPAGTELSKGTSGVKITIGDEDNRDVVVTIADGATVRNCYIDVMATLVFEDNKTDNRTTNIISSDVIIDETPKRTYTNIYTALDDAADNSTVTINRNVFLDKDAEIRETITLAIPAGTGIYLDNEVTLSVNGTIQNSGKIGNDVDENGDYQPDNKTMAGFNPYIDADTLNSERAEIVVNGAIMSMTDLPYSTYFIPGAYYQMVNDTGAWNYITPVEQAAAVSNDVEKGQIGIFGENTVGDVAFTGDADQAVTVTVNGDLDAGTVTLTLATLDVKGSFDGTVGSAVGTIDVVNGKGFTVVDTLVGTDDVQTLYLTGNPVAADDELDASVTVATGTVNAGQIEITAPAAEARTTFDFVIASGATLMVAGDYDVKAAEFTADEMTVDGTLVANDDGLVDVDTLTVRGTFTVMAADDEAGTNAGKADITTLYVGIAKDDKTGKFVDASAATVDAESLGNYFANAYVSGESTITADLVSRMNSTEFYVEDALWLTVYTTAKNMDVNTVAPGDLVNSEFSHWIDADGEVIDSDVSVDGKIEKADNPVNVGQEDAVYAVINYNIYTVTVFADPGITAVYIDGKLMTSGVFRDEVNGMWAEGFQLTIAAGTHEITYKLGNYFSGEANMTVDGVAVSGNTFTTSGTTTDDKSVEIYLQGIEASAPETPSTSGGDDGMGLTDYLLIILVVLIVVMAIIVALRLMRS